MDDKFAAKFAEAGNLKLQDVSQFPTSSLRAAVLTLIVFHSMFPQAVKVDTLTQPEDCTSQGKKT